MNKPLTFLFALTFLFLFSGSVYGDDFEDGADAYKRQDYKEALRLFHLSSEQGNVTAQVMLGAMYASGRGVPQDYKEAVKWYRFAAEQGHEYAQYNLGNKYKLGQGVPQDYASAHMWWNICGSGGNKKQNRDCVGQRDIIEKQMSPSQIEKAQDMARNWKPKR
jgi:hypothetical protein